MSRRMAPLWTRAAIEEVCTTLFQTLLLLDLGAYKAPPETVLEKNKTAPG